MNPRSLFIATRLGLGLALGLGFTAAQAAELTLYEHPNYAGMQVTIRGYVADTASVGFSNRASSLLVTSGRWEICSEAGFRGECVVFQPGEYPQLDSRFNNRVASLREVGSYAGQTGSYSGYRSGSIQLYEERNFGGRFVKLDGDTRNFAGLGFNDRAASIVVTSGNWELCSDADFGGECRTYGPGRYADLGRGMAKLVSSARLGGIGGSAPAVISSGFAPAEPRESRVFLYDDDNFKGRSMAISRPVIDLERTGFNDRTASLIVEGGSWLFCSDAQFRGFCRVLAPGEYRGMEPSLHRSISSLRPAGPATPRSRANAQGDVELFAEPGFGGERFGARGDISNLEGRFNDRARSMIVYGNLWEVCVDSEYRGPCAVYGPGEYPQLQGFDSRISSLRRVQ